MIRPLRGQPRLSAMVGTLAVGAVLLTFAIRRYGVTPRYPLADHHRDVGRDRRLVRVAAAVADPGRRDRGADRGSDSSSGVAASGCGCVRARSTRTRAGLVGVNNDSVALVTWLIAGALAGVSAILIAPTTVGRRLLHDRAAAAQPRRRARRRADEHRWRHGGRGAARRRRGGDPVRDAGGRRRPRRSSPCSSSCSCSFAHRAS